MARCPVCDSTHVVVVMGPRHQAFCSRCGVRWTQEGREQRAVHRLDPSAFNISGVSVQTVRPLDVKTRKGSR